MKLLLYIFLFTFFCSCTGKADNAEIKVEDVHLEEVAEDSNETKEPIPPPPPFTLQRDTSIIEIDKGISLAGIIESFDPEQHRIDTCVDEFKQKYICKIDGKSWYGMDKGLSIPQNQFISLNFIINNKRIPLEVSQMFNPNFGYHVSKHQFTLKKDGSQYELFGFFSDGAGTYEAKWQISGDKSRRIALYNPGY